MPVHKSRVQRSARPRFFGKKAGEKGCLRCDIRGRFRCFGDGCLHPSLASKVPHVLRRSTTDRAATVATDERDNVVEMHESRSDAEGEPRTGFEDFVRAQYHARSEEHTSELQSLMRISYAVFCLKKKTHKDQTQKRTTQDHVCN